MEAHKGVTLLALALAAILVVSVHGAPAAQDGHEAGDLRQAYLSASPDALSIVVQLRQIHGGFETPDTTPLLRVYGDGRVLVHYPAGMKKAGDYSLELGSAELTRLLGALVDKGVLEFDAMSARRAWKQARLDDAASGRLEASSDDTTTLLEVHLAAYSPGDGSQPLPRPVHKEIVWYGLKTDARRYPDLRPLRDLAAAEELLLSLTRRDELQRVEPSEVSR